VVLKWKIKGIPQQADPNSPAWRNWYSRVYLQSEHWRWRRDLYMLSVGYYCEANWNGFRCRSPGTQVHHLIYDNLFAEKNADLQLLCDRCHKRAHKWPKAANDNGQLQFLFDTLDKKKG
jgi:5-methylcytosine-specific restriction endonuclease McrA